MRKAGGSFHLADDRMQRAVRALRRAEIAQARVRLGSDVLEQRRSEPRFADPGLATKQHHLSFTGLCLGPPPKKQFKFFLTADKGGEVARMQRLETALYRTRPQCGPCPYWRCDSLKVRWPEVLKLEETTEKSLGVVGDDDGVG